MPEPPASCPNCGVAVPEGARFCPSCGTTVAGADAPRARPHWFGLTPPTALLVLAVGLLTAAVVLIVLGSWVAGLLVLGLALLFGAGFLETGRRKPDSAIVEASDKGGGARARAGSAAQAYVTRSTARREINRRRAEAMRLTSEREGLLRRLGEAVYAGGDGSDERAAIQDLDARIQVLEREAAEIATSAQPAVQEPDTD